MEPYIFAYLVIGFLLSCIFCYLNGRLELRADNVVIFCLTLPFWPIILIMAIPVIIGEELSALGEKHRDAQKAKEEHS